MIDDPKQVTEIFRALFLADIEAAGDRGLDAYIELFPGHEALIRQLHDRMSISLDSGDSPVERTSLGLDTSIGARVGHFRIEKELGRGGQAVVFQALDEKLGRSVALKVLIRAAHRGDAGLQRFKREAEVCSRLNHKNICQVYDTGIEGGFPFIAMELVDGMQLTDSARSADELQSEFHFSSESIIDDESHENVINETRLAYLPDRKQIRDITKCFIQIASALEEAHLAGVIHRDIKPGNIMLRKDMSPVILDFGLAQDLDSEVHALTQTGDFFGTPAYMSPEQISAHRIRLDSRTDIFSLGASLYECLCGRRPFDATTRDGIYQAILTKEPPKPRSLNPEIPRDLEVIIAKAIEKDRDRRYSSAAELAADLQRFLDFQPIHAKPAGLGLRLLRWSQRNRAAAVAIVGFPTVIGLVLLATTLLSNQKEARVLTEARAKDRALLSEELDELSDLVLRQEARIVLVPRLQRRISGRVLRLGDEGMDMLVERLRAKDQAERIAALTVLVDLPELAPLDEIVRISLEDEYEFVQAWATQILMRIDSPGIVEAQRRVFEEAKFDGTRVNALFGMILNEVSDGPQLVMEFIENGENDLSIRQVLAFNLMILRRQNLNPVADWLESTLTTAQLNEWSSLIEHHKGLAEENNITALNRILARKDLSPHTKKQAKDAVDAILNRRLKGQAD